MIPSAVVMHPLKYSFLKEASAGSHQQRPAGRPKSPRPGRRRAAARCDDGTTMGSETWTRGPAKQRLRRSKGQPTLGHVAVAFNASGPSEVLVFMHRVRVPCAGRRATHGLIGPPSLLVTLFPPLPGSPTSKRAWRRAPDGRLLLGMWTPARLLVIDTDALAMGTVRGVHGDETVTLTCPAWDGMGHLLP